MTARVILGFDTATTDTAVAVSSDGTSDERRIGPAENGRPAHNTELLPAIEELVAAAGGWDRIGLLAVGLGPGSFTGLRIGISTARALAQSRGLPITGVPTTSALLAGIAAVPEAADRPHLAVIDARRGEVFAALDDGAGAGEPVVCAPTEIAAALNRPDALLNAVAGGDGAIRFRTEIETAGGFVLQDGSDAHRLSASRICELAADMEADEPVGIRPMYLRRPDAERWRERDGNS